VRTPARVGYTLAEPSTRTIVPDPAQPAVSQSTLDQLQLHIGDRLQLEMAVEGARAQHFTLLIGYVPGHSVLVRTPLVQNLPVPVREGEPVTVRSFSGRHAASFESAVLKVSRAPFPYLHLAYPQVVKQALIRGALRVRVNLSGTATNPAFTGSEQPVAVNIVDLSVSGALIEAESMLGEAKGKVDLAFKFTVQPNNYEVRLLTSAEVQSVKKGRRAGGAEEVYVHGMRFARLHTTESLLLQSYIQQIILSDRSQII
jgi:c-di-GMP-binding flagellar brake protein YcgR